MSDTLRCYVSCGSDYELASTLQGSCRVLHGGWSTDFEANCSTAATPTQVCSAFQRPVQRLHPRWNSLQSGTGPNVGRGVRCGMVVCQRPAEGCRMLAICYLEGLCRVMWLRYHARLTLSSLASRALRWCFLDRLPWSGVEDGLDDCIPLSFRTGGGGWVIPPVAVRDTCQVGHFIAPCPCDQESRVAPRVMQSPSGCLPTRTTGKATDFY